MVRAMLHIKVIENRAPEFEAIWRAVAEQVRRVPGNLRQSLLRDIQEPNAFVISSDWASEEAFRRFERSPEQDALTAPIREVRESARMTVQALLLHIEGEHPQ